MATATPTLEFHVERAATRMIYTSLHQRPAAAAAATGDAGTDAEVPAAPVELFVAHGNVHALTGLLAATSSMMPIVARIGVPPPEELANDGAEGLGPVAQVFLVERRDRDAASAAVTAAVPDAPHASHHYVIALPSEWTGGGLPAARECLRRTIVALYGTRPDPDFSGRVVHVEKAPTQTLFAMLPDHGGARHVPMSLVCGAFNSLLDADKDCVAACTHHERTTTPIAADGVATPSIVGDVWGYDAARLHAAGVAFYRTGDTVDPVAAADLHTIIGRGRCRRLPLLRTSDVVPTSAVGPADTPHSAAVRHALQLEHKPHFDPAHYPKGCNAAFMSATADALDARFGGAKGIFHDPESREIAKVIDGVVAAVAAHSGRADGLNGATVLELGCGTGLITEKLVPAVGSAGHVHATEVSPGFIDLCRRTPLPNRTLYLTEADNIIDVPTGVADVAFICDVYHHLEYPKTMMRDVHRVLKPGGIVILIDFVRDEKVHWSHPDDPTWVLHHVRAGQKEFEREIAACGFVKAADVTVEGLTENYVVTFTRA